ncbi:hypothetical protein ACN9ML_01500 [Dyadobacter endophyticus]|uniref:hypothetical protein n=1 Tax=Dyadobacter TaxID=120831 RepID=UPI003CEE7D87
MRRLLAVVSLAFLIGQNAAGQQIRLQRFEQNPIIGPELLSGNHGRNINGPSLIKVPDWVTGRLGKYYLYFADHNGTYIRLAFADELKGPWKVYEPGTLKMDDCACKGEADELKAGRHIASPDLHIDPVNKQLVMYFHCPLFVSGDKADKRNYKQLTLRATSADGIHFKPETTQLGESYFRVFEWKGQHYAISRLGILWRSPDGIQAFERGPNPFDKIQQPASTLRHAAVKLTGDTLWVFHSRIGDSPERIYLSKIHLNGDWNNWKPTEPQVVAIPETKYEGSDLPLTVSKEGAAHERLRELRDPAFFEENGKWYLLYSVAAESGIAIGELKK